MKITLIKQLDNSFKIAYPSDYEKAKKIKAGEEYQYEYKKPRNYQFHKKFFALFELVYQNQDEYENKEHLRSYLTMKSGYVDEVRTKDGVMYLPKSISFSAMEEDVFSELFDRFLDVCSQFLGLENQDILNELKEFY